MKYLWIIITIISLAIISCNKNGNYKVTETNGVKSFVNKKQDKTRKNTKLLTDTTQIIFNDSIQSLPSICLQDGNGYFYILDAKYTVNKFSPHGKHLLSFCRQGQGPGEVSESSSISILNDTVYVIDAEAQKIQLFTKEGSYLKAMPIAVFPQLVKSNKKNTFAGLVQRQVMENDEMYVYVEIVIYNSKFKPLSTLYSDKVKIEMLNGRPNVDLTRLVIPYDINDSMIVVADHSEDKYAFKCYDLNGKLKYTSQNSYRRLAYSEKDLNLFKKNWQQTGLLNDKLPKYKKAINEIYIDTDGSVLVRSSKDSLSGSTILDKYVNGIFSEYIELSNLGINNDFSSLNNYLLISKDAIYSFVLTNKTLKGIRRL